MNPPPRPAAVVQVPARNPQLCRCRHLSYAHALTLTAGRAGRCASCRCAGFTVAAPR